MSSERERTYIEMVLVPEILEDFAAWSKEYQQPRDLGLLGEFASLYRKVRKLKTILWDGADPTFWRESLRTIVKEVVAHGLLMLCDVDEAEKRAKSGPDPLPAAEPSLPTFKVESTESREVRVSGCGPACSPRKHVFAGECRYRYADHWTGPAEGNRE